MGIESIDTIFVFQCGNPNQEFACPNCKKPIGGMSYKFAPGQKTNIGQRLVLMLHSRWYFLC